MRVTSVIVTLARPTVSDSNLIAYASIQLDDSLRISSIRVIKGDGDKKIVAMPSRLCANGGYRDVVYPVKQTLRDEINRRVVECVIAECNKINESRSL